MTRLVKAGHRRRRLGRTTPHKGLVTTSVVSFIVRKGNPKNIKTWDDLLKPGIKVLTPNPFTSGAAKWNLLAAYGQASDGGKDPQAGLDYVTQALTDHVTVQDKSGREALQDFTVGQRRRAPLLRVRGDDRAEEGRGRRLRHARTTRSRSRSRSRRRSKRPPRRRRSSTTCCRSPARSASPTGATARSTQAVLAANAAKFPEPARPVHDRATSAAGEGQRRALRPRERARSRRSRRTRGSRPPSERAADRRVAPLGRRRAARARPGAPRSRSALGVATLWLSLIVLLPLAAVVAQSLDGGLGAFWDAVIEPPGGRGAEASRCSSRWSSRRSTPSAGTLIAWVLVRDGSAASASSTR